MSNLTLATVAALVARKDADVAKEAPKDYNGFIVTINYAKPVDHVEDVWKSVVTRGDATANPPTSDVFNLRETLIYRLWVLQDKPDAATALSQDVLDKFAPMVRIDIARTALYKLGIASGIDISFRASDCVAADLVPAAARNARVVDELVSFMQSDEGEVPELGRVGSLSYMAICANAIHREQNEGHNWFTALTRDRRSATGKACSIGGSRTGELMDFMADHGHDAFHHLSDATIHELGLAISGSSTKVVSQANFAWANDDVQGKKVSDILHVSEAARGRYPAGVLGKAALVICCDMANSMVTSICQKLKVTGAENILPIIVGVKEGITSASFSHESVLNVGAAMGDMISYTFGYCTKAQLVDEDDYQAYKSHALRNPAMVGNGRGLAVAIASARAHEEALVTSAANALTTIARSFTNIAYMQENGQYIHEIGVEEEFTGEDLVVEAGENRDGKLMDAVIGQMAAGK